MYVSPRPRDDNAHNRHRDRQRSTERSTRHQTKLKRPMTCDRASWWAVRGSSTSSLYRLTRQPRSPLPAPGAGRTAA
eukprot:1048912-Prymnesium_polylepis.1